MRPSGDSSLVTNEAARLLAGRVYLASNQQQEEHMDNEGMQQLKKEEKIRKAVGKVSEHVSNLQWEIDRMGTEGKSEYTKLWNRIGELEKLCR